MSWQNLESVSGLSAIVQASGGRPQLIFKHSTRCGISAGAKRRLDAGIADLAAQLDLHYLDLIAHRDISAAIAEQFSVRHESPQVLLIQNGSSILDLSHYSIEVDRILAGVKSDG
ncbi:MAG: bacillithiol system redox-active protein YtxJ [Bacteroidota bacterium]